ncbi:Protein of unknown function [Gryllus bimaculatus]|nr:Protein of unknown function [Gryllus bimaculatus]
MLVHLFGNSVSNV